MQIFDASTNSWKVVNEQTHTDFVEKICEQPRPREKRITDITLLRDEKNFTDTQTNISNISNTESSRQYIKNQINILEINEDDNITRHSNLVENDQKNVTNLVSNRTPYKYKYVKYFLLNNKNIFTYIYAAKRYSLRRCCRSINCV